MDVEFATQLLQLRFGRTHPRILVPGTLDSLERMAKAGVLSSGESRAWSDAYRRLREVESRLRLMNTAARHDLPEEPAELARLTYVLRESSPDELRASIDHVRHENRARFLELIARLVNDSDSPS